MITKEPNNEIIKSEANCHHFLTLKNSSSVLTNICLSKNTGNNQMLKMPSDQQNLVHQIRLKIHKDLNIGQNKRITKTYLNINYCRVVRASI